MKQGKNSIHTERINRQIKNIIVKVEYRRTNIN